MISSLSAQETKKTLQIALVGIRPADQVMLKGYMRVLLRLDTDLEWVSANHPTADLYMINNEFAQAESVQKLISNQPNTAVLYVQRDENAGGIVGNILTLPLKELEQLKKWLTSHIPALNSLYSPKAARVPSPAAIEPPTQMEAPSPASTDISTKKNSLDP